MGRTTKKKILKNTTSTVSSSDVEQEHSSTEKLRTLVSSQDNSLNCQDTNMDDKHINDKVVAVQELLLSANNYGSQVKQLSSSLNERLEKITVILTEVKNDLELLKSKCASQDQELQTLKNVNQKLILKVDQLERKQRIKSLEIYGSSLKIPKGNVFISSENVFESVKKTLKQNLDIDVLPNMIEECRLVNHTDKNKMTKVFITTSSLHFKDTLITAFLQKRQALRNGDLYINECLSYLNSEIFYRLRQIRKKHKDRIYAVFTRNGFAHVKEKATSSPLKLVTIEDVLNFSRTMEMNSASTSSIQHSSRSTHGFCSYYNSHR